MAIRATLNASPHFVSFEEVLNSIYKFYYQHGHKRKAHLKDLTNELHMAYYELNYVYKTRWIASEQTAVERLKKMWLPIVKDLEAIQISSNFDAKSKESASDIENKLKGKQFVLLLHFMSDVLESLAIQSKKFQEKEGSLIGMEVLQNNLLQTFEDLKVKNGKFMTSYLSEVQCSYNKKTWKYCLTYNYDKVSNVKWKDIILINDKEPKMSSLRSTFLSAIKEEILHYFPDGSFSIFSIFLPENMPRTVNDLGEYGKAEVIKLANMFKLPSNELLVDWYTLITSILESTSWCK